MKKTKPKRTERSEVCMFCEAVQDIEELIAVTRQNPAGLSRDERDWTLGHLHRAVNAVRLAHKPQP